MSSNDRYVVRRASDRPGFAVLDTHESDPLRKTQAVRTSQGAAQERADELNAKHNRRVNADQQ